MEENKNFFLGLTLCTLFLLSGCDGGGGSSNNSPSDSAQARFDNAVFSNPTQIDNTYLPIVPETTHTYQSDTEDGNETIIVAVLDETKVVAGVTSVVVQDSVYLDELLVEDTLDWFAQDDDGNIWYMGEESISYEYDDDGNLIDTSDEGSWQAGVGGAVAGILFKGTPIVGDTYQQEFLPGEAEDMAEVVALDVTVTLADGTVYTGCVKTQEWNPLEIDSDEYKYYAPGVGLVSEEDIEGVEVVELKGIFLTAVDEVPDFSAATFSDPTNIDNIYLPLIPETTHTSLVETEDEVETIITEVLDTTRIVNGVECVVFHDRVFVDELLLEDTFDWFAQDDNGNVWYMGEEVINYEYDDEGDLIETNDDGSWEAGVDDALPGVAMWADPIARDSYYQEYYEDEATDMGFVVALGVEVEMEDGTIYEDCLQTLDWNPQEPAILEYKYYAPGIGTVKEEVVGGDEVAELKGIFLTAVDEVPDFSAATFSAPTVINNTYLPLIPGIIMTYEGVETEDGVETIVTEVLDATRIVNGVECVVFNDKVFLDDGDGDVLIEDTNDWFAQDDNGNVWYMGEEVINYEYDDEGDLIETNDDGSWEAGVDDALPGVAMWADPIARDSYYQEYYEDEATDMGFVVALGVEVELGDGTIYENCVQTLDWNPMEPGTLEYKYYAPGVGMVMEEVLGGDEVVELISIN